MQKRNTKAKQWVMNVLENSHFALCHEDIEKRLSKRINRVTIYRILQSFCDEGKVHKITSENGKTYYALCHTCSAGNHHDNHLHFHCVKCNTILCIDELIVVPELPPEYSISSVSCFISGYCPDCQLLLKTLCLALLFCFTQLNVFAQHQISVLDKTTNEPVAFANVYYPDTKTGTYTDVDGRFTTATSGKSILVQISSLGYKTVLETLSFKEKIHIIYMEQSVHELQEIVVSDHSSKLQGENVINVEKLNLNHNTSIQGVSLSEKLSTVAGIDNFTTGTGIGKPVIRGLSGNRVAVFSQGIRLENQQWGDEHGLGLDENGYEQVEIIKGPASLLYGSDALGGALYFVDERYAKENSIGTAIGSAYNSNTNGWRNTGAVKLSKNRFHWNTFGGYTTHEDYRDGNHFLVPNSRFQTADFKTSVAYTGNRFITSLKYSFLKEQYGLTESQTETDDTNLNGYQPELPYQDLTTHLISSENTFFFSNESKLKVDIGTVFNNRKEFEDSNVAALAMNLGTLSYNAKWYSPKMQERWTLIVGSQGMYQTNTNHGQEMLVPNATTVDIGAFAVSNYYYSEKSYWQAGLRMDGRHISGNEFAGEEIFIPAFSKSFFAFNFSTGSFQQLAENWSFRTNLSSGYRAPNMFELLSNGVHEGTNRYEIGHIQLKTENSYQIDASLSYQTKHLELFVSPYFNYIRNYIYLQPTSEMFDGFPVFYYEQTDAYLYGGEAGFHFHPHPLDWLHLESSYGYTVGKDKLHNNLPLIPSQKIHTTVSAVFSGEKAIRKFSGYLHNQYSFMQDCITDYETSTPAYGLFNVGVTFEVELNKQKLLFNVAVNNIFDKVYYDHLSRYKTKGIYYMGRNFNFRLNIPLQWKMKTWE
jgi:iron complex outermembrane receptor protein